MSDAFEAGKCFIFLVDVSDAEDDKRATELAIELRFDSHKVNRDVLESFTRVDFIVSSERWKDSIEQRGLIAQSNDVNANYSTLEEFKPYVAASIPFSYSGDRENAGFDANRFKYSIPVLKFTFGDGNCPPESITLCQNEELRPDSEYW